MLPLCSQILLPPLTWRRYYWCKIQESSLRLAVVESCAVKIYKHSGLSAFCKTLPFPWLKCSQWARGISWQDKWMKKMTPPWWRPSGIFPVPGECSGGKGCREIPVGWTADGQSRPSTVPWSISQELPDQHSLGPVCCTPGHSISSYVQGYKGSEWCTIADTIYWGQWVNG